MELYNVIILLVLLHNIHVDFSGKLAVVQIIKLAGCQINNKVLCSHEKHVTQHGVTTEVLDFRVELCIGPVPTAPTASTLP